MRRTDLCCILVRINDMYKGMEDQTSSPTTSLTFLLSRTDARIRYTVSNDLFTFKQRFPGVTDRRV
jgi:hypothetical protein